MIAELSVSQLAIIDRTTLSLSAGLTVLTGETGAGKSLLIDAIQLALGERADADLVRDQARSATVSVAFDLHSSPEIRAICEENGVALEEDVLFVVREVFAEGRSQCRLGGRLTPVSALRQIGEALVDLHGQHDHQSLLHPERHLGYFDRWIGADAIGLRERCHRSFSEYASARRRLEEMRADIRNRDRKLDLLRHEVAEIEAVSPSVGEFEQVEDRLSRLQNIERLVQALETSRERLSEGESSALESTGAALQSLEEAAKFDRSLVGPTDQLREALFVVEDVASALRHYMDGVDASPDQLDELANRLESLKRLRRKYGPDEAAVLAELETARGQILALEDVEASETALEESMDLAHKQFAGHAAELSEIRRSSARNFSDSVEKQLHELALEKSRFAVGITPSEPSHTGVDDVEFVFSANPGEPLRSLHRVASGGEVSRLMLGLKTVLAESAGVPTLIFDEIDSGLGGRVGTVVGKKLAALATRYQVLVISHLPQVAALADTHFRLEKDEQDGRTVTRIRKLNDEQRTEEIARMIAGDRITETALAHARELLASRH